jgi:hypothetical protein
MTNVLTNLYCNFDEVKFFSAPRNGHFERKYTPTITTSPLHPTLISPRIDNLNHVEPLLSVLGIAEESMFGLDKFRNRSVP